MDTNCTLYIDEAGDLGVGRGTEWFVLAGVIVNKSDEKQIREVIRNIRQRLNVNEIHFRKMMSFDKKAYAVSELSKCPFEYITVIANTSMIKLSLKDAAAPSLLSYNHICRYLLERASWLLRDTKRKADIVLSSRGTSRDNDLIEYINKLILYGMNKVSPQFGKIRAETAAKWDMLQLADVCATSMFNMHERNGLNFITPCYAYRLNPHLYRHNGHLEKYGVKYYDDKMMPKRNYFIENAVCQK